MVSELAEAVRHCCGASALLVVRCAACPPWVQCGCTVGPNCRDNLAMTTWFVFNGDADGICAAHQLRLAGAQPERVVTGVKRDVRLLARAAAEAGDQVMVADISLDANREALEHLLAANVRVKWFDHHYAGDLPQHACFEARINTAPDVCSSLLVDQHLNGRYRAWAVTAAFGDNLAGAARAAAAGLDLGPAQLDQLQELGMLMNYNAYGESIADLHVDPAALFARLDGYADPLQFIAGDSFVSDLRDAMQSDLAAARGAKGLTDTPRSAAFELPDAPWARRVQGVFANELAAAHPQRAHALLVRKADAYVVSVRAPQSNLRGADGLCLAFSSGGGRAGAAGINHLPAADVARFLKAFRHAYP